MEESDITSKPKSIKVLLKDVSATLNFAFKIGSRLKGGETIELIGDLGAGKTTFVIGLAKGAGISEPVSSPSFTIRNDYAAQNINIAHFDFFRLSDPGELKEMLSETLSDRHSVVVIEWGSELNQVLPPERVKLTLKPTAAGSREAEIAYPEAYAYLFEEEA